MIRAPSLDNDEPVQLTEALTRNLQELEEQICQAWRDALSGPDRQLPDALAAAARHIHRASATLTDRLIA